MSETYLPDGLPTPIPMNDGLDKPYWDGLLEGKILVQRCGDCGNWQWGPEWICHSCNSFNMNWTEIAGEGTIYSWERPWDPVHGSLKDHGPYLVVLVELPQAGNVRMIGNLLGDPTQEVTIGTKVKAVIERHDDDQPYALVQWQVAG